MFWIFRIIVTLTSNLGIDIGCAPMNTNIEIALLFIVLLCIILVARNNMIGAIIYILGYGLYFGYDLYNSVNVIMNEGVVNYLQVGVSFIAVCLAVAEFFDMVYIKSRATFGSDKETDWFFKSKEYDRKYDERADRNEYRNY